MAKRGKGARGGRRVVARLEEKMRKVEVRLGDTRVELALLERGGTPEHPLDVDSASIVEMVACGLGCARCGGATLMDDHRVVTAASGSLRLVETRCKLCGVCRKVYVRIQASHAN